MKRIDSISVAEVLMNQFSTFGIPKNAHMDHVSILAQI